MARRLSLLVLAALPALARGQSLTFAESNDQDQVIGNYAVALMLAGL